MDACTDEPGKQSTSAVRIMNVSRSAIAFKVSSKLLVLYLIHPLHGLFWKTLIMILSISSRQHHQRAVLWGLLMVFSPPENQLLLAVCIIFSSIWWQCLLLDRYMHAHTHVRMCAMHIYTCVFYIRAFIYTYADMWIYVCFIWAEQGLWCVCSCQIYWAP